MTGVIGGAGCASRVFAAALWCAAALIMALPGGPARAQAEATLPFPALVQYWTQAIDRIEASLATPTLDTDTQIADRATLADIRSEAADARRTAEQQQQRNERLLEALGPVPAEGESAEPDDIRAQREAYAHDAATFRAQVAQAELILTRIDTLEAELAAISRQEFLDVLLEYYANPFAPRTLRRAAGDTLRALQRAAAAPQAWWSRRQAAGEPVSAVLSLLAMLLLAAAAGIVARGTVGQRLRADPAIAMPTYGRRIAAVAAAAVRTGAVPMAVLGALLYLARGPGSVLDGLFQTMVAGGTLALMLMVMTAVLAHAILVPPAPQWRIVGLSQGACLRLERGVSLLAVALAAHVFLRVTIGAAELGVSGAFIGVMALAVTAVEAALILRLMRRAVWQTEALVIRGDEPVGETHKAPRRFWSILRPVISVIAVLGVLASALGYPALGLYVVGRLCASGLVIGAFTILRGLLREAIGMVFRASLLRETLEFTHRARSIAKFWARALLDVTLLVLLAMAIAVTWSAPIDEVVAWLRRLLSGFVVGHVRVSIGAIVTAILIFLGGAFATRMLQRGLRERVLPQTHFDPGVQNSLASGFGYVGIAVAIALAVAAAGIDLSNFALIAGALSVGIGFGLQNVVNNFVSGLILLIERPVKVGDWIVIGGNEGFVKNISVRATELETFQRASVIIPNADILSNAVQNWTHKDRIGRIEIPVGVAYGSDVERVEEILLSVARDHELISATPEPHVLFMDFADSSLNFELRCFTDEILRRLRIASELRFAINRRFAEAGIEIPFPQRVVHLPAAGAADDKA